MVLRPLFSFRQASLLVSAAPTSLSLLLSDSRSILATLSIPPSFLLPQSLPDLAGTVFSLLLFYQATIRSTDSRFSWGTTRLMSWASGERYSCPLQSIVVSALTSRIRFSWTGGVLSHLNSSIDRFPRFPSRNLCSLHARCVFSRLCCNGHSLLLSFYVSRIGRIENPSCSACVHSSQDTSHLILHCLATDSLRLSLFVSLRPVVQALGSYPASGAHGLPPCPHPSKGVG